MATNIFNQRFSRVQYLIRSTAIRSHPDASFAANACSGLVLNVSAVDLPLVPRLEITMERQQYERLDNQLGLNSIRQFRSENTRLAINNEPTNLMRTHCRFNNTNKQMTLRLATRICNGKNVVLRCRTWIA